MAHDVLHVSENNTGPLTVGADHVYSLDETSQYIEDQNDSYDLDLVKVNHELWQAAPDGSLTFGYSRSSFWVHTVNLSVIWLKPSSSKANTR